MLRRTKRYIETLKEYNKCLLSENIDLHNQRAVCLTVLDKHGLKEEACKMLHDLMPDSYDENMEPIYKEASPYAKLEEKCRREIERRRNRSNFITKAWNRFIKTFSRN